MDVAEVELDVFAVVAVLFVEGVLFLPQFEGNFLGYGMEYFEIDGLGFFG